MRFPDHSDLGVITIEGVGEFRVSMDRVLALAPTPPDAPEVRGLPIYCTGGCDVCRDYARELGVPLITPTPPDALDVERLAKAMRKVHEECRDRPYDLIDVPEDVAREYAALRSELKERS